MGRSIPDDRLEKINQELEGDIMVRQVYDVKGIDMGNGIVRYKARLPTRTILTNLANQIFELFTHIFCIISDLVHYFFALIKIG